MLLHEILEHAALRAPSALALTAGTRSWTFPELRDRVRGLAGGLQTLAAPGEHVAILSENAPAYVEHYYAAPRAGLVLTLLNHRLHPEEWASTLAHAEARVLIGERDLLERVQPLASRFPSVRTVVCLDDPDAFDVGDEELRRRGSFEPVAGQRDDDPAWLLYTSGTTGRPKGALLTHRGLVTAVLSTALARPVTDHDVYLFPFPLCHVAGYNVLLFHLHARPVVLMRRFDPADVLADIPAHGVTNVSLAPTMIAMLLEHPDLERADLSTLRSIGYGASGIPADVLRRGMESLGCDFAQGYGMTELSGNAAFLDAATHRRALAGDEHLLRAAGRPGPLAAIRVVDEAGHDVATGKTGEIVVRGDQVTPGYWRDDDATRDAFAGGWFHTGDLGRLDEEGFLSVVDRKKDVIVTGGENVASPEIEDVLHRHPAVREAAVIGLPDERWGEAVTAVVVRREGTAVEGTELVDLCRRHLAGFKKPRHVVFVDGLPKNHAGKVQKRELRELVPHLL